MILTCFLLGHRLVACGNYHKCSRCYTLIFHPWPMVLEEFAGQVAHALVRLADAQADLLKAQAEQLRQPSSIEQIPTYDEDTIAVVQKAIQYGMVEHLPPELKKVAREMMSEEV